MMRHRVFCAGMVGIWAALCAATLIAREVPWRAHRPWELLYEPARTRFTPDKRLSMIATGDLGVGARIRALQHPHAVTFTTDSSGYRNATEMAHPRVVIVGDSFAAGCELSDEDTLAVRLAGLLGQDVYNFGTQSAVGPLHFLRESRFIEAPPEVVVFTPVARNIFDYDFERLENEPLAAVPGGPSAAGPLGRARAEVTRLTNRIDRKNEFTNFLRRTYNEALYAVYGYSSATSLACVIDGEPALVLTAKAQGLTAKPHERGVVQAAEEIAWLSERLAQRGIRFVCCPIPETGTIYPENFPATERARMRSPSFLDVLFDELEARKVDTVDLRGPFRENRFPYLFLRDGSHWNPRAVELAAQTLARRIEELIGDGESR